MTLSANLSKITVMKTGFMGCMMSCYVSLCVSVGETVCVCVSACVCVCAIVLVRVSDCEEKRP